MQWVRFFFILGFIGFSIYWQREQIKALKVLIGTLKTNIETQCTMIDNALKFVRIFESDAYEKHLNRIEDFTKHKVTEEYEERIKKGKEAYEKWNQTLSSEFIHALSVLSFLVVVSPPNIRDTALRGMRDGLAKDCLLEGIPHMEEAMKKLFASREKSSK